MFTLSASSRKELNGVEPELVEVVERALELTTQDFAVHDGIRTPAEQREYVRRGTSKTMKSKHLLGRAVDLVPFINRKLRWEWEPIYEIASAMSRAAEELGVELTWGGSWDKPMSAYPSATSRQCRAAVEAYKKRHPGPDFLDGPHFELVEK